MNIGPLAIRWRWNRGAKSHWPDTPLPEGAPYDAKAVANFYLSKRRMTQMDIHKLVYLAHGWHLGFIGSPLIDETVEAWRGGVTVPTLRREFLEFGADVITRRAQAVEWASCDLVEPVVPTADEHVHELLEKVWQVYRGLTPGQLAASVTAEGSPWRTTRDGNPGVKRACIPNAVIREHYEGRIQRNGDAHDG